MEVIHIDKDRQEVRELDLFSLDLAYGDDENDFSLALTAGEASRRPLAENDLISVQGTEFGGIVDTVRTYGENDARYVAYCGRTWSGILAGKIIFPENGKAYLTVSGEANAILRSLISRLGLDGLFHVPDVDSGIRVASYSFNRYTDAWTGIRKMLLSQDARPAWEYDHALGSVRLQAVPCRDHTDDVDVAANDVDIETARPVNHLVCLGSGQLASRIVVNLYADGEGNVSEEQTFFGTDEIAETYDYSGAEREELIEGGTQRLKDLQEAARADMELAETGTEYHIGDLVGGTDDLTGISVTARVAKKIVRIDERGRATIQYEQGTAKTAAPSGF